MPGRSIVAIPRRLRRTNAKIRYLVNEVRMSKKQADKGVSAGIGLYDAARQALAVLVQARATRAALDGIYIVEALREAVATARADKNRYWTTLMERK